VLRGSLAGTTSLHFIVGEPQPKPQVEALTDFINKFHFLRLECMQGKWQQVLDLSGKYKATAAAAQDISQDSLLRLLDTPEHVQHNAPHHRNSGVDELQLQQLLQQQLEAELSYSTFKILALMRLRRHSQASLEFQQLGHLPQQQLAGMACYDMYDK